MLNVGTGDPDTSRLVCVRSSSASSAMLSISVNPEPEEIARASSKDLRGLERTVGSGRSGLDGRAGECGGGVEKESEVATSGSERVLAIGGAVIACAECDRR